LVTPIGRFTATLPRLVTNASTIVPGWARAINSPATAPSPLAVPSLGPVDLDQLGPTGATPAPSTSATPCCALSYDTHHRQ
jgi:hypothetical protein